MIAYAIHHTGRLLRETLAAVTNPTPQDGPHSPTWPETWAAVPGRCPICQAATVADRHLDSAHGPGWRCTHDAGHYWRVRLSSLRRALVAHSHLPRCTPEVKP